MKLTPRVPAALLLCLVCMLFSPSSYGAVITIGEPPDPGTGNCFPFGCTGQTGPGTRYQQVYDASLFPSSPIRITGLDFFHTQIPGGELSPADYAIYLSTTTRPVNGLDTANFDSNRGTDNTLFFSGFLSGPVGAVFGISSNSHAFVYNSASGNLLMDVIKSGGADTGLFLDSRNGTFDNESSRAQNFGAQFERWGLVTGFIYETATVPEPAALIVMGAGLIGVALIARKLTG
ncbi:MAG TPA: PEP-CTERM sorting domain-containing protein [Dissulfurispiraceae bacterium]